MTRIAISDLRTVIDKLLVQMEESGQTSVELKKDFYWSVQPDDLYNPYQSPKELTLGQLTDDWSELQGILQGTKEPLPYALVWAAALLRYAGENLD
ncbi:MAG: hypothetical protein U1A78_37635 [Polyangia bacterium]